jgi:hypothetical protein
MSVIDFSFKRLPELASTKPIGSLDRAEVVEWATNAIFDLVTLRNDGSGFNKTAVFIRIASVVSAAVHAKPEYDAERAGDVVRRLVAKKSGAKT